MKELRQHQSDNHQYEGEEEADHIRSLNNHQPLHKSKKKDLKITNLHKLTHKLIDDYPSRPQSTRSQTKTGLKAMTPRVIKLERETVIRGEYYPRERSVKKKKNID
jgi:hypothetical protein